MLSFTKGNEPKFVRFERCEDTCGYCSRITTLTFGKVYKVVYAPVEYKWVRIRNDNKRALQYSKNHFHAVLESDLPLSPKAIKP